jgi:hypothetical protein
MTYLAKRTAEWMAELLTGEYEIGDAYSGPVVLVRCRKCGRQQWMLAEYVAKQLAKSGAVDGCMCGKVALQPVKVGTA